MIQIRGLHFRYDRNGPWILQGLELQIQPGEFVVLVGPNGSGKSTLAELVAGLLTPSSGQVMVDGLDSREHPAHMRGTVGLVFQNPEHQFFHTTVAEDVAFGPENLGLPPKEVEARVARVLKEVGMVEFARHAPHQLSGGQKQLVAIAGILAMEPGYLVLDEPTAMLDPRSRRRVRSLIRQLHRSRGCGVLWITQDMEELLGAQRALVLHSGRIAAEGSPEELLQNSSLLQDAGLDPPLSLELELLLRRKGMEEAAQLVRRSAMDFLSERP